MTDEHPAPTADVTALQRLPGPDAHGADGDQVVACTTTGALTFFAD